MNKWKFCSLEELGEITSSKRIFQKEYVNKGIPFYRTKEIKELANKKLVSSELFISMERYEEIRKIFGVPKIGDILITAIGTVGEIYIVEDNHKFYFKDGNILWFKSFNKVNPFFLKYLLFFLINDLKNLSSGSAYKALPIAKLKRFQIPLPPIEEQRRIAAILDQADAIRRKRQQAIALTDELLRSTFLEMFGDPVINPMGWEVALIDDISEVQGGLQVTSKRKNNPLEMPYLRVANVYRDRLVLDEVKTIRVTEQELKRTTLQIGDLLIVEGNGNAGEIGRSSIWDGSISPCLHQNHLIRVRLDFNKAIPIYISAFLNSAGGRRQLNRFGKTTSGLNTISTSNVKATEVLLPPVAEQNKYTEVKKTIEKCLEKYQQHYQQLDNLFNSLLQRAFKGQL